MSIQEAEIKIKEVELELVKLNDLQAQGIDIDATRKELLKTKEKLIEDAYGNMDAYDRVYLARHQDRPNIKVYIDHLFNHFIEMHGDRLYRDDPAICGGIAFFHDTPVTVIGHVKGQTVEENIACNFGMACPEGYRKALRLMKQADKFNRPIITFIDTPGAYPGLEAEEHGQGEAIARSLMEMSTLSVPIIAIVIGEGGSGGALALSVANQIVMLENSVYSVLSPEGFASILYKDASKAREASQQMKLTAQDLYDMGICDHIIKEPVGGITQQVDYVMIQIDQYLTETLARYQKMRRTQIANERYKKYREIGNELEKTDERN